MREKLQKLKGLYEKHERHISSGALLSGFVIDNLTLTRIDLWLDNLILFSYISLSLLGIILINLYKDTVPSNKYIGYLSTYSPLLVQFAFGGLFSGLVIFYVRGATFATSWPFLLILIGLLIGNEFLKERYYRLIFQLNVFFIALFSFWIFYLPILVNSIGSLVFILSGVVSLISMGGVVYLLYWLTPLQVEKSKKPLLVTLGGIFILINVLYFANIIPPLPLSMKHMSVCHNVERSATGNYTLTREDKAWYESILLGREVNIREGESVYLFSSVFAPTDLKTDVAHSWQYYNERDEGEWVERSRIEYSLVGGRGGGYRGYTFKENIKAGKWRVNVVSADGRLIGRKTFKVNIVDELPKLETVQR